MSNPNLYEQIINSGVLMHPFFVENENFLEHSQRILARTDLPESVAQIFDSPYFIQNRPEIFLDFQKKNPQNIYILRSIGKNL
jgi:hypothetical protein